MLDIVQKQQIAALGLPSDQAAPVFAAPWEASAFAMVLALYKSGRFEWREWVELLAAEISAAGSGQTGERYYDLWTKALEKLLAKLDLLTGDVIAERAEAWRAAYLATPHGEEVRLDARP